MRKLGAFTVFWLIVVAGVLADASVIMPLDREIRRAGNLLSARAVVVVKLIRRFEQDDVAYLVFENQHVVRGSETRKLLVFGLPEPLMLPAGFIDGFHSHSVDAFKKDRQFLITITRPLEDYFARSIPLSDKEVDQERVITRELQSYQQLDRNLELGPWKAVADGDLFVKACTLAYYQKHATPEEVVQLLTEYVQADTRSKSAHFLVQKTLESYARRNKHELPPNILADILAMKPRDDADRFERSYREAIRRSEIQELAQAKGGQYDKIFVEAMKSDRRDLGLAALEALASRKVPGALECIRNAVAGIPSEFQPAFERNRAARALHRQIGRSSVDEVLRVCAAAGDQREEQLRQSFDFLAQYADAGHVAALRSLDDPSNHRLHGIVTRVLVCAGDADAQEEHLRLTKERRAGRRPYFMDPGVQRNVAAWQRSAKWLLANRQMGSGSGFINCAEILLLQRDPELGDLVAPLVSDEFYEPWATRFLALAAHSQQHRVVLQRLLTHERAYVRAYAWAGLAKLRDENAMVKIALLAAVGAGDRVRFNLNQFILPRMDIDAMEKAWARQRPEKSNEVDTAVHEYVLNHLKSMRGREPWRGG